MPLLPPAILMLLWRSGERAGGTGRYFEWTLKGRWVLDALRDRWELFDLLSVAVILAVLALVLPLAAFGRGIRFGPRLAVGALAMVVAFVLMPRIVIGSNYADMRMVPFVLAALLLAVRIESARLARWTAWAGAACSWCLRIGATTVSYAMTAAASDRQLAALDHVAPGSRVVALVENTCRDLAAPDRVYHLPSMAVVRRAAFVNDQFELPGAQLLTVRYTGARPFVEDPSQIVTPRRCGGFRTTRRAMARLPFGGFDHLWLIDVPRAAWPVDPRLTLRWSDGDSALVRRGEQHRRGDQARRATASSDTPTGNGTRPTRWRSDANTRSSRRLTAAPGIRSSLSSRPRSRPSARAAAIGGNSSVLKWVSVSTRRPAKRSTVSSVAAV